MSSQEEELEVLESIYDNDECFEKVSNSKFQYKFGDDGTFKAFIIEIEWGSNYPEVSPTLNLDLFYNKHLGIFFKAKLLEELNEIMSSELGNNVTYTIIEHIRENFIKYIDLIVEERNNLGIKNATEDNKKKVKKEQFTKSQKRRIMSKLNEKGELPRGHDWVSVIKHLQQTGIQF